MLSVVLGRDSSRVPSAVPTTAKSHSWLIPVLLCSRFCCSNVPAFCCFVLANMRMSKRYLVVCHLASVTASVMLRIVSLYNRKMDIEDLLEEPLGLGDSGILFHRSSPSSAALQAEIVLWIPCLLCICCAFTSWRRNIGHEKAQ